MLKVTQLENLDNFKIKYDLTDLSDDFCRIPLFHGTTAYAFEADEETRKEFRKACDIVMRFAKEIAQRKIISDEEYYPYTRNKNSYFLDTTVYLYGSSSYEYDDFYLTTSYSNALIFAHVPCGELGNNAYYQCVGFKDFNIELPKEVQAASNVVTATYVKYRDSEKIILVYEDINFSDLYGEKGYNFLPDKSNENYDFLSRHAIETLYESEVDDCSVWGENLRIKNPNDYTGYIMKENLFREGFKVFTNVTDVDKFIKHEGRGKWNF